MSSNISQPAESMTVRFASVQQEISPEPPTPSPHQVESPVATDRRDDLSPEEREELRNSAMTMQQSRLQKARMDNFNFEPVSLPVSRVPSGSSQRDSVSEQNQKNSPSSSAVHTPPLTPAQSGSKDQSPSLASVKYPGPSIVTPQTSSPHETPLASILSISNEQKPSAAARARFPVTSDSRPKSMYEMGGTASNPKHLASSSTGTTGDSLPTSNSGSPNITPRPGTPGSPSIVFPEEDNPYARSKRQAQDRALDTAEKIFIFGEKGARAHGQYIPTSSSSNLASSNNASKPVESKRLSLFSGKSDHSEKTHGSHGSMSELKRFFKLGKKDKDKQKQKRDKSPGPNSSMSSVYGDRRNSGTRTPPSQRSSLAIPFADDHGIESKYGKFGKMLGSGAGGSVRLMKRSSDGVTFAVKQFRDKHSYESEKEYNRKVTAEFCIGSSLHHGNIIETMDIIQEKGKWYEVMEYAPFDLFAIVMTGKMSREEISCATLQILNGLTYLHDMGLAHRDMKLDNVVVNEHGIMKIIDFGSAVVFKYPFEDDIVLASGIVGSDPYLAPEVYDASKYDPRPTDIWSLAIMFCCMTLRRFPWKAPRITDNSYKLFVSEPTDEERRASVYPQRPTSSEPATRQASGGTDNDPDHHHHYRGPSAHESGAKSDQTTRQAQETDAHPAVGPSSTSSTTTGAQTSQPPVIKGPWRLLRLLPRETRHIVGRMLELDPKKRATIDEMTHDPWVLKTRICEVKEGGEIVRPDTHTHTLEPSAGNSV